MFYLNILKNLKDDFSKNNFSKDNLVIVESLGIVFFELINNTDESFEFFEFIMKIINSLNKFNCELEDKYYLINQN